MGPYMTAGLTWLSVLGDVPFPLFVKQRKISMAQGKKAAIDLDDIQERALDQVSAADFLSALSNSGVGSPRCRSLDRSVEARSRYPKHLPASNRRRS
jgi:hypothetical protein